MELFKTLDKSRILIISINISYQTNMEFLLPKQLS